MEAPQPLIHIEGLSVTYFMGRTNEVRALRDISLDIYPGEFIIFFGPSGCGKSTLLYSIAGLETHARGSIMINGKNVADMRIREIEHYRQRTIGMIFQAFYLIDTLSVIKNVVLPMVAIRVDKRTRTRRAKELLDNVGVGEQIHKLPSELSGGQQQRVAIARALVNAPEIIFADEPVGNLDSKSANDVMQLIQQLHVEQHKTVVLVTHDPSHLHLANRVFYMKDGYIVETKANKMVRGVIIPQPEAEKSNISKELELLIRTYSSISPGQLGTMLIPFKAKQIVSEVLTGLTSEEVDAIEQEVKHLLLNTLESNTSISEFLDRAPDIGGVGLDKRTAQSIGTKVKSIIDEIRFLQSQEQKRDRGEFRKQTDEVTQIRQFLLEAFDLHLKYERAVAAMDTAIEKRVANTIDQTGVQTLLDRTVDGGGAGLDRRTARKMAKRLELLLLGKFNR